YNLLEKCVNGITANKAVCEGYVYNSIGIVTYLKPVYSATTNAHIVASESIHILTNACYNLLEKCVNGITANKAVCEGYVYNSIGIVTYL
ncbi:hypothetical protein CKQ90_32245, partial [Klebsiella pneumoniae]